MAICPTTITTLAALYEPCLCDRCDGAAKLLGKPCAFCHEARWGCRSLPCPWCPVETLSSDRCLCGNQLTAPSHETCSHCWLADYRARYRGATALQSLWRGYSARKTIQEKNAEEVLRYTPIWRSYDDQYRMYVFCQTLMAELKKDDPSWDATQEPYYIWMMENGPILEEWETFLFRRGWVRPKKQSHLNTQVFKRLIQGVLESCGLCMGGRKATMALYNTFMQTR
jgi:hypothetical protein